MQDAKVGYKSLEVGIKLVNSIIFIGTDIVYLSLFIKPHNS